jgi:hypothetical protein
MRLLLHALLVSTCSLLHAASALADEDPRRKQAEPLFVEGLALHDGGREQEALAKFQRAYEIYPSPNALFQIARSEHLLGRHLDALKHYREALQSRLVHPKNAELGKGFVGELEAKLARVTVVGPAGARCRVGAAELVLPMAEPLDVEPGDVAWSCAVGEARREGRAAAARGGLARIEIQPSAPEAAVTEPPPAQPSSSFWTTKRTLGVAAGGLAVIAAGVGGFFLASREGHVSDGEEVLAATPQPCAQPAAPSCAAYDDARDGVKGAETGAIVAFAATGVLAATSAVLILWPDERRAARLRVVPIGSGLSLSGTF